MSGALERDEYVRRVLEEIRERLLQGSRKVGHSEDLIFVEDVRLDDSGAEDELVVLLRDKSRPRCLFGWRWSLAGWDSDPIATEDPYFPAMIAWANLEEHLVGGPGLPWECDPEGINWF